MGKKVSKKKAVKKASKKATAGKHGQDAHATGKRSALVDTGVIYCGDNLDQLVEL